MKTQGFVVLCFLATHGGLTFGSALASSCPAGQRVHFETSYETQYGQSVFLLGDMKELGANDMRHAIKLEPSAYPVWKIDIQLPVGASYSYKFVVRSDAAQDLARFENGVVISDTVKATVGTASPLQPARALRQHFTAGSHRDYAPNKPPKIVSRILKQERAYRVVLPPDYEKETNARYPVIYAHDGQNVFDQGPFGSWNVLAAMDSEIAAGRMQKVIVVGVDNTAERFANYIPPGDRDGAADKYVEFIKTELKPFIDKTYRTRPEAKYTGTFGSSLGGLVAMYMLWDYSDVFGRAGVFSPSFQMENFTNRVKQTERPTTAMKLYLDSGESGTSNDGFYNTRAVRDSLVGRANPFLLEGDLRYVIGLGQSHNEAAWSARLPAALSYLYPACEAAL